jgi:hypothetical protein
MHVFNNSSSNYVWFDKFGRFWAGLSYSEGLKKKMATRKMAEHFQLPYFTKMKWFDSLSTIFNFSVDCELDCKAVCIAITVNPRSLKSGSLKSGAIPPLNEERLIEEKILRLNESRSECIPYITSSILRFKSTFGELRPADLRMQLRMHAPAADDAESATRNMKGYFYRQGYHLTQKRRDSGLKRKPKTQKTTSSPKAVDGRRTSKRQRKLSVKAAEAEAEAEAE